MALWLRADNYSIELVNILPTFIDLLRALSSWLGTTLAGCLSLRGLWTFQASFVFFAIIVLAVWDVPDILDVVPEAHELVDDGLVDDRDFRDFVFTNPVALWTALSPSFFDGTAVEGAVARELAASRRRAAGG